MTSSAGRPARPVEFDVWGCRGSRSLPPGRSILGSHTSCYSLFDGETLLAIDAGRGLSVLSAALREERRFRGLSAIRILVSHAHIDHWEGLKEADWFWERGNGLDVTLLAPAEALRSIAAAHEHPSYVPLSRLAVGTAGAFRTRTIRVGRPLSFGAFAILPLALHHYAGSPKGPAYLQTAGFRISHAGGAVVAYVSDHEPTAKTAAVESRLAGGAGLVLYDASYARVVDHAYGHGSQEYAASVARADPSRLVLAGHHGPLSTDRLVDESFRRFGRGLPNYRLAREGDRWVWNRRARAFRLAGA